MMVKGQVTGMHCGGVFFADKMLSRTAIPSRRLAGPELMSRSRDCLLPSVVKR